MMEDTVNHSFEKILILASSSTGNNVFCTPAIRFLRKHRPDSIIDVVALNSLSAEVFEGNADINSLHVVSKRRVFDNLAKHYSTVICLNGNAIKKLSGIKTELLVAPPFVDGIPRAEQLLQFVATLLNREITDADRHYVIGSGTSSDVAVLENFDIDSGSILINIHLGLGRTSLHGWKFFYRDRANDIRLWPIEDYIKLGQEIIRENPRIRIVITGTRNESFLARKFVRAIPETINLVGKTSASDIYNLMSRLSLFIAHDCGVFHIASASDVPIVGLYGPTDPVLAGPYPLRPQHRIIKKESMTDIKVSEVVGAAFELLGKFPRNRLAGSAPEHIV